MRIRRNTCHTKIIYRRFGPWRSTAVAMTWRQSNIFTLASVLSSMNSCRATIFICRRRHCRPKVRCLASSRNTDVMIGRRYVWLKSRHGDDCWTSWSNPPIKYSNVTCISLNSCLIFTKSTENNFKKGVIIKKV